MSAPNPKPNEGGIADAPAARRGRRFGQPVLAVGLSLVALVAACTFLLVGLPDHDRAAAKGRHADTSPPDVNPRRPRIVSPRPLIASQRHGPKPARAVVTVRSPLQVTTVPRSYLGLSTEYWALPVYEQRLTLLERVLSLLHVRGDGPFVLRIGGDSADQTFWEPRLRTTPPWVYALTPARLRQIRTLVRQAHLRVILDLNLITGSPHAAARLAQAAERVLPRGSIIDFEIGNEPDIYSRRDWLAALSETPLRAGFLRKEISTANYIGDFDSYSRALKRVVPGVPLAGPALANPVRNVDWIARLLAGSHPGLGTVTAHRYLYSACAARHSPGYPTIRRLLSEHATGGVARKLEPAIREAHRAGLEFRLSELNSVSCRGVPGISDAFATALWAPDMLFELLRAGANGVNVHVRTNAINAAFTLGEQGLGARPLLYGLILFARALGPGAQLVRSHLHASHSLNLKVWATRVSGDVLHVLLIDKGERAARVRLRLPARGPARIERLLAPSAQAISGVTLAGQRLGRNARWHGRLVIETIKPGRRGYEVSVPGASAALVTIRLGRRSEHRRRAVGARAA